MSVPLWWQAHGVPTRRGRALLPGLDDLLQPGGGGLDALLFEVGREPGLALGRGGGHERSPASMTAVKSFMAENERQ